MRTSRCKLVAKAASLNNKFATSRSARMSVLVRTPTDMATVAMATVGSVQRSQVCFTNQLKRLVACIQLTVSSAAC